MIRSLTSEAQDSVLACEVCVVGGGPVGITAALTLLAYGIAVVLVESGSWRVDPRLVYRLASGRVTGDDRFGRLDARLGRGVGGTASRWVVDLLGRAVGVRYATMDPGVLARRSVDGPSWPFTADELRPWYRSALGVAGVRPDDDQLDPSPSPLVPGLEHSCYMFGESRIYADRLRDAGTEAGHLTVLTDATVTDLRSSTGTDRVDTVEVRNLAGRSATIRTDTVVLAAGAVDTTRLLLHASRNVRGLRDNARIGRNLMDRPRLYGSLVTREEPPDWFAPFALHAADGHFRMHRLISARGPVEQGSASTSFLLTPMLPTGRAMARLERSTREALVDAPAALLPKVAARTPGPVSSALVGLDRLTYGMRSAAVRSSMRTTFDTEWADWARSDRWRSTRHWRVTAISEQMADQDNMLTLSDECDDLGVPRAHLHWGRPASVDAPIADSLLRAAQALESAGVGAVEWAEQLAAVSSCHMMGTVAIGSDPSRSAADRDGRVHGTSNVHVVGNATIPQSGHANPTLLSMALAARTATIIAGGDDRSLGTTAETPA